MLTFSVMTDQKEIGLGIIGFGGFALFASQHFLQLPNVRLVGIAGSKREEAVTAAKRFGATNFETIEELLDTPGLEVVYVATPPFLHYSQSMMALRKGKHVICEKPLAVTAEQAGEMITFAREKGLLMVTNLMQRYNPMFERIQKLVQQELLGDFLHGYFENFASDEGLPAQHWFWDREKSGGIFVEHGVHFFDLWEGWLGPGKVVAAQVCKRGETGIEDQVNATVRYGEATVNFYHGFTQPSRMDRQETRLLFERGDLTLYEWVPTRLRLNAVADEATTRALMNLFEGGRLDITGVYSGKDRAIRGRHQDFEVHQKIQINAGFEDHKMHIYGELLREMFRDQMQFLTSKTAPRKITEANGHRSLLIALEADRLARL